MAEISQAQVKPEGQPVKKRRFFRPRPKVKPAAEATEAVAAASKAAPPKVQPAAARENKAKPKISSQPANGYAKQLPHKQGKPDKQEPRLLPAAAKTTTRKFRPPRAKGVPKQRLSDIDFKYLDTPDFKDIYVLVTKAKEYFATDKETCCAKFRIANEAIIERLIKDLQLTEAVAKKGLSTNYFEQINLLSKEIPSDMVDSNVFTEMHNIRMIGNSFAHGDDKYDAIRGCKTCLIAMEKICRWFVDFEPKYLSYQRAKNMTKSNFFADIWQGILSIFKSK